MTKNGKTNTVKETRFENKRLTALGIEPMNLSDLRAKVPAEVLMQPERLDFYMLMLVTAGRGFHTVDFVKWPLKVGSILFVRPGQVQQWQAKNGISAHIVLIDPSALPNNQALSKTRESEFMTLFEWQSCMQLPKPLSVDIGESMRRLQRDFASFENSDMDILLIRHELLALLFRLARWQLSLADKTGTTRRSLQTYRSFVLELEASFRKQHNLKYYANRLGYVESTISRACLSAEGRSAKLIIDRRIALEGKRMLVHSVSSVAEIGHYLGFSEPTNFVKFFRRTTNTTPNEFRKQREIRQNSE